MTISRNLTVIFIIIGCIDASHILFKYWFIFAYFISLIIKSNRLIVFISSKKNSNPHNLHPIFDNILSQILPEFTDRSLATPMRVNSTKITLQRYDLQPGRSTFVCSLSQKRKATCIKQKYAHECRKLLYLCISMLACRSVFYELRDGHKYNKRYRNNLYDKIKW